MRFKSPVTEGFEAFAVSGANTVSFAITATDEAKEGLLGFAVRRRLKGQKPEFRPGFKVFRSLVPHSTKETRVSTNDSLPRPSEATPCCIMSVNVLKIRTPFSIK